MIFPEKQDTWTLCEACQVTGRCWYLAEADRIALEDEKAEISPKIAGIALALSQESARRRKCPWVELARPGPAVPKNS